jgi:DNA replicative helicase MCM subunit Mcm2 (Cdc46/Mcm family)
VAEFRASEGARGRVADLIHREKTGGLSTEETAELESAMQLEHIMRLAKARARLHLS